MQDKKPLLNKYAAVVIAVFKCLLGTDNYSTDKPVLYGKLVELYKHKRAQAVHTLEKSNTQKTLYTFSHGGVSSEFIEKDRSFIKNFIDAVDK